MIWKNLGYKIKDIEISNWGCRLNFTIKLINYFNILLMIDFIKFKIVNKGILN